MKELNLPISIEKFAAFLDGTLSPKEMNDIYVRLHEDERLMHVYDMANKVSIDAVNVEENDELLPQEIVDDTFELPNIEPVVLASDLQDSFEHTENSISFGKLTENDIQQQFPDTCAIKSQQIILESHDVNITEEELLVESIDNGWYTPGQGGTAPEDVGNLLEYHGMTVNRYIHGSIDDIATELARGHHVIVGVDSGELWEPNRWETFEDFLHSGGADHALIVSGIQINPLTSEREVILTDPGTGEVARTYTVEQFEDAWNDSNNFFVIAE